MLFYKVEGIMPIVSDESDDDRYIRKQKNRNICMKSDEYNKNNSKTSFYFVSSIDSYVVTAGVIEDSAENLEQKASQFFNYLEISLCNVTFNEITIDGIETLLHSSYGLDFIEDIDIIMEKFNLNLLTGMRGRRFEFDENIIDYYKKDEIYSTANKYLLTETLIPELNRIYYGTPVSNIQGHPVHYVIQTDDQDTRHTVYNLILQALYENKRLKSKRYSTVEIFAGEKFSFMTLDTLYKVSASGAIVIRYNANDDSGDDDHAICESEIVERICEVAKRYRNKVLTIICLPRECTNIKKMFYENLETLSMIELQEEFVEGERAEYFLKMLAEDAGIDIDQQLFHKLKEGESYLAPDLHNKFNEWYDFKLKTSIYPQYKDISVLKNDVAKSSPKGTAYDELQEMIGLTEAKQMIQKAINYYKLQKLYVEKGIKKDTIAMHMVFTGNPGTAKTTVARLFARIMKDNGLLSKGQLIEVGRADLVGKFVGWTAPTVKSKFKAAIGGVLFIDEAYSLVDGKNGLYGDEAINTIVQEMENHRDDMAVIFAGYPDKMETFLQKNPGLRSRIAFHIPFDDYNVKELCDIAKLIGKNKGLIITQEAETKLEEIFATASRQADFGNGRYVRNIIEKARMEQASRLIELDFDELTAKDVATIKSEDIIVPKIKVQEKAKIGFIA